MKWSWTLGHVAGIKLRMHWTFLLLLAWVGISYAATGGWIAAVGGIVFVLAVFVCIILHECGHALTAARYGVPTEDITLLPIGGLARMQRIPDVPLQEFWIAVAGPAVNVVIAAVLFVGLMITGGLEAATSEPAWRTSVTAFFVNLMWVNIALVAFNALPAFPMDGGRVFRALLATQLDYVRATRIAAGVGQGMAILFGVIGLFINPLLLFIALFVYLGAEAEAQTVQFRDLLQGMTIRNAMMTQFRTLHGDDTLEQAVDQLLAGSQQDFPVMDQVGFQGMLSRQALVKGIREAGMSGSVSNWTSQQAQPVGLDESLVETLDAMRNSDLNAVPVMEHGELVGLLCVENISELLMVRSAAEGQSLAKRPEAVADAA